MNLEEYIKKTEGQSYTKRALGWFKANLGNIVTSSELAQIPGTNGKPISHNMRRIFELRDEAGYEIVNWKNNEETGLNLKVDQWVLLKTEPNPNKVRDRGVNKRIMFDVFERDNYQCQSCGRILGDDDPFSAGRKIKLHVGHIKAHKRKSGELPSDKKLTKDDFITMCNVCNEGAKNKDIKIITLLDRVKKASSEEKRDILAYLCKNSENL